MAEISYFIIVRLQNPDLNRGCFLSSFRSSCVSVALAQILFKRRHFDSFVAIYYVDNFGSYK